VLQQHIIPTGCSRRSGRDAYSSYTNTKQQQVMPTTDETDTNNLPQHNQTNKQTNKGLKLTLALAEPTATEAMIVMMVENFIVDDNG